MSGWKRSRPKPQRLGLVIVALVALSILTWMLARFVSEEATGALKVSRPQQHGYPTVAHRSAAANLSPGEMEESEETRSEASSEMARTLRVLVVDSDDLPVEKAPVLLVDRGGRRQWRVTNRAGATSFEHPGVGHLLVRMTGHVPVIRKIAEERDAYTLRLGKGLHIQGRLLIDGNPPGKPLTFSASVFHTGLEERFYAAIQRPANDSDIEPIPLRCDVTGAFRIDGIQAGWTVRVNLPEGLRMMKGEKDAWRRVYHVETIRSNVVPVLRTVRRTRLVGTCRDLAGAALAGVHVELRISLEGKSGNAGPPTTWGTDVTDEEGHFELWVDDFPAVMKVAGIQVVAIRLGRRLFRDIASTEPRRQVIPDFVFPTTHRVRIHVIGDNDQPIPNASVGTTDGRLVRSTDLMGFVTLPLVPGEPLPLHIAARGYGIQEAEITAEAERTFTIRLRRASRVVFRFQWDDGTAVRDRRFLMSFHGNPFRNPLAFSSAVEAALFHDRENSCRNEEHVIMGMTGQDGEFVVDDLRPGSQAHVYIYGYGGQGCILDAVKTIEGADHEQCVFTMDRSRLATIEGTVVTQDGQPVSDAAIIIGNQPNRLGGRGRTDDRGRFVLRDVVLESAYVRVGKPGFRATTRFVENLRDLKGPLTFRMRRAARCRLVIEDAQKRSLAGVMVRLPSIHSPGMGPVVLNKGWGIFEIVDLGDQPCIATVYGPGGAKRKITIRPDVDTLKSVSFD